MTDEEFMEEAVRIAVKNVHEGGGPFGAVIVKDGKIVARGVNRVTASLDPTAHAEVQAIRAACRALGSFSLEGCVLYTSCEPCPMCLSAVYWARIDRIFYACTRDDAERQASATASSMMSSERTSPSGASGKSALRMIASLTRSVSGTQRPTVLTTERSPYISRLTAAGIHQAGLTRFDV